MLSHQQSDLWNRIRDFDIDDPFAFVKYSDKLAHANGWSKDYSLRVIEEYKKFIFLCCVLPRGASPPKPIDEAWHLHLTYTRSYWKELCEGIIGKEIHHLPSKGGPEENDKHLKWYNDTLDSYKEIFGNDAPADIWTPQKKLPASKTFQKEGWEYLTWYKKYLPVLAIPFLLIAILYNEINPYNLAGPHFLVFFSSLIIAWISYVALVHSKKTGEVKELVAEKYKGDADVYQIARFVYGRERSLRAAIIDLAGRGILEPRRRSTFIFHSSNYKYSGYEKNPLVIHLLRNVNDGTSLHYNDLTGYYDDAATYHAGLDDLHQSTKAKDFIPLIAVIIVLVTGIARVYQGLYNLKPVGYLFLMCIIIFIISVAITSILSAKNIITNRFKANFRAGNGEAFDSAALASSFIFLGMSSVSEVYGYDRLQHTFSKYKTGHYGTSSSGCGSSGCGGSSCGGGGCGGGCGGCGGS